LLDIKNNKGGMELLAVMDSGLSTALTSSLGTISVNILGAIAIIAPIALGIVGIFLAWGYGMRFFKKLSK
jgi:hypothetical protein